VKSWAGAVFLLIHKRKQKHGSSAELEAEDWKEVFMSCSIPQVLFKELHFVVDTGCPVCYIINIGQQQKRVLQMDYRDFAIELVEDMGYDAKDMLIAALKYMSQDDVEDMLHINEYPTPCEEAV